MPCLRMDTKAKDPTSADLAVPRAFRQLEEKHSASRIARDAGFSVSTLKRTWNMALAFWLFISFTVKASDISPGFSFTDGQRLTATQLGLLVSQATINPLFYTAKTISSVLGNGNTILIYDSSSGTFKQISSDSFILNNTNWFTSKLSEKSSPNTNDMFLIYDATGQVLAKTSLSDINNSPFLFSYISTNWQNIVYLGPTNSTYPTNIINPKMNALSQSDKVWIYDSVTGSNVSATIGQVATAVTNSAVLGETKNLVMMSASATTVSLTADEIITKNPAGASFLVRNASFTYDITHTGPNAGGVDIESRPTNTWFYAYVVSDATNVYGLLSQSSTAPVYTNNFAAGTNITYKAIVGMFFQSATNVLTPNFYQYQNRVSFPATDVAFDTNVWLSLTTNYAWMGTNYSTKFQQVVPPISHSISGFLYAGGWTNRVAGAMYIAADTNGVSEVQVRNISQSAATANSTNFIGIPFTMNLITPTNISWKFTGNTMANPGSNVEFSVTGYGL